MFYIIKIDVYITVCLPKKKKRSKKTNESAFAVIITMHLAYGMVAYYLFAECL